MSDRVTVHIDGGVADVRLNRPDKLNALDGDTFAGLVDAGARLARDPSVRAVVLSGEGRAFSAGLDFSGFQAMAGGGGRGTVDHGAPAAGVAEPQGDIGGIGRTDGRITHLAQQAAHCWSEVPVPVDRRDLGPLPRRRPADRAGRRHPHRAPRDQAVGAGDPLGPVARHDRHRHAAPARRPRRGQGADLDRPHGDGGGGRPPRSRHPHQRRPAGRRPGARRARSRAAAPTPSGASRG